MEERGSVIVERASSRLTGIITGCPECAAPAEVEWITELSTDDGCVEHLKIQCINRHWFLLASDRVPGL
jgi:hypothetical protein